MKIFAVTGLAFVLIASSALAAPATGTLAPGKPAGVKKAQSATDIAVYGIGAGLVGFGVALSMASGAAGAGGNNRNSNSNTGTATGTP